MSPFTIPARRKKYIYGSIFWGLMLLAAIRAENGLGIFALTGFIFCVVKAIKARAEHGVFVTTAGMNQRALATPDGQLVGRVLAALNQAIAMR